MNNKQQTEAAAKQKVETAEAAAEQKVEAAAKREAQTQAQAQAQAQAGGDDMGGIWSSSLNPLGLTDDQLEAEFERCGYSPSFGGGYGELRDGRMDRSDRG